MLEIFWLLPLATLFPEGECSKKSEYKEIKRGKCPKPRRKEKVRREVKIDKCPIVELGVQDNHLREKKRKYRASHSPQKLQSARKVSVFSPGGSHQQVKLVCVLPFPDGDARKDTKIYPGSGMRRPYVQRGGSVCIILHLSACTGVNTSRYG